MKGNKTKSRYWFVLITSKDGALNLLLPSLMILITV